MSTIPAGTTVSFTYHAEDMVFDTKNYGYTLYGQPWDGTLWAYVGVNPAMGVTSDQPISTQGILVPSWNAFDGPDHAVTFTVTFNQPGYYTLQSTVPTPADGLWLPQTHSGGQEWQVIVV